MSEAQHIYQAIGELQATLVVTSDGAEVLQSGSDQYPAFIPHKVEEKYQEKYQGQQVYWRVYPKVVEQRLAFEVVTLAEVPKNGLGQFKLQGDWVESGQLQIWRNAIPGSGEQREKVGLGWVGCSQPNLIIIIKMSKSPLLPTWRERF